MVTLDAQPEAVQAEWSEWLKDSDLSVEPEPPVYVEGYPVTNLLLLAARIERRKEQERDEDE